MEAAAAHYITEFIQKQNVQPPAEIQSKSPQKQFAISQPQAVLPDGLPLAAIRKHYQIIACSLPVIVQQEDIQTGQQTERLANIHEMSEVAHLISLHAILRLSMLRVTNRILSVNTDSFHDNG